MRKASLALLFWLVVITGSAGQQANPTATVPLRTFNGYFNITDIGLLIGSPENSHAAPFSFLIINGFHLTNQFSTGLGLGVEFLSGSYLPVFLDLRYYVRNANFSPFFFFQGGYSVPLDDNYSAVTNYQYDVYWPYTYRNYKAMGGWLLNPGFGIRNMFSDNFGLIFSVGYRNQRLFYRADDDHRLLADYNRLVLRIGILFR